MKWEDMKEAEDQIREELMRAKTVVIESEYGSFVCSPKPLIRMLKPIDPEEDQE